MPLRKLYSLLFPPRPRIRDLVELADFIDAQSAFLVQKGIYEYARARAGHYAKVLFSEQAFLDAVDRSRWRAYPLGLAMVGELVEGVLRPESSGAGLSALDVIRPLVLSVFDRYPLPNMVSPQEWADARIQLDRRLQLVGLHPPKRAMHIPEPFARAYFDLMPIHKELRGRDFPTTHSYLQVTLCNIHDELTKRLDAMAIAEALRASESDHATA
jgi:hypothetical protein